MVSIEKSEYRAETIKARKTNQSIVVTLSKDIAELEGITDTSMVEVLYRKVGDISRKEPKKEVSP